MVWSAMMDRKLAGGRGRSPRIAEIAAAFQQVSAVTDPGRNTIRCARLPNRLLAERNSGCKLRSDMLIICISNA